MLKNKKVIIFSILFIGLLILSVHAGWCVDGTSPQTTALSADIPMKTDSLKNVLGKFSITMGGVLISLLIIWAVLSLVKEFGTKKTVINSKKLYDEPQTPKTVDEAIVFFIRKNRLK